MLAFKEMDETVTLQDQLSEGGGPVILMNKFTVKPEEVDRLIEAWTADAIYFKKQPGFISSQLHRGIAGSCVFLNNAVWESVEHFGAAFRSPEFHAKLDAYPSSTVASPHLFRKVAVPDICVV